MGLYHIQHSEDYHHRYDEEKNSFHCYNVQFIK